MDAPAFAAALFLTTHPMAMTVETDWIQAFEAGTYPQGTWTNADVDALARSYNPEYLEAAVSTDHRQSGPSFGWVSDVKTETAEGVRQLWVKLKDLPKQFAEAVNSGNWKRVSIEPLRNFEGHDAYLKAVSFLGVKMPQVKGMEVPGQIQFSEAARDASVGWMTFEHEDTDSDASSDADAPDSDITPDSDNGDAPSGSTQDDPEASEESEGSGDADDEGEEDGDEEDTSDDEGDPPQFTDPAAAAAFEQMKAERDAAQQQLQETEAKLTDKDRARRRQHFEQFCSERIPPAVRDSAFAVFDALDTTEGVQFSHETHDTATEAFKDLLEALSFGHLFGTFAEAPDDASDNTTDLKDAVREEMRNQGYGA